ncbi:hypothetical protein F5Y19DRAFT_493670 [Xylariaceae sp. FL1651]|nr:hypothetical protein F5Y19DRAFT_493670 [Xylariaceae sp. FL1651]
MPNLYSLKINKNSKWSSFRQGVYIRPSSRFNADGRLGDELPRTSSRAEIEALSQALEVFRSITADDFSLTDVKIASDSDYLVKAISKWVSDLIEADGVRPNGQQVAHFDKLREIYDSLDDMENEDDAGIRVQLWHVPREENWEADALAN